MTELDAAEVNALLQQLCAEIGAPIVNLDEAGEASFSAGFEDSRVDILVVLHPRPQTIMLLSPIGTLEPSAARPDLAMALMGLNLSAEDTAGVALAVEPEAGRVFLVYSLLGPRFPYDGFRYAFLRLCGLSHAWQARVQAINGLTAYTPG